MSAIASTSTSTSSSSPIEHWDSGLGPATTTKSALEIVASKRLLPSQVKCPNRLQSSLQFQHLFRRGEGRVTYVKDRSNALDFVIYYHDPAHRNSQQKCVLYFNPNAYTAVESISSSLDSLDDEAMIFSNIATYLAKLENCPVIFFDYRGSGLNNRNADPSEGSSSTAVDFYADAHSLINDGIVMIRQAASMFGSVSIWGTSIGGGISTVSLQHYLKKSPEDTPRFQLTNHNSFSSTAACVGSSIFYRLVVSSFDAQIDAKGAMRELIQSEIPITIITHLADHVIGTKAQMLRYIRKIYKEAIPPNVTIYTSPSDEHGDIDVAITQALCKRAFAIIEMDPSNIEKLNALLFTGVVEGKNEIGYYTADGEFVNIKTVPPYIIQKIIETKIVPGS